MERFYDRAAGVTFAAIAILIAAASQSPQSPGAFSVQTYEATRHVYPVLRVLDGDTIEIQTSVVQKGQGVNPCKATPGRARIRLLGINAPEIAGPFGKLEQPWGPEATARMHALLDTRSVWMEYEPGARKDLYGRTLGHVFRYPDGMYVNAQMLAEGLARQMDVGGYPKKNRTRLAGATSWAQAQKLNIWSKP